jgi:hypothetical protein
VAETVNAKKAKTVKRRGCKDFLTAKCAKDAKRVKKDVAAHCPGRSKDKII